MREHKKLYRIWVNGTLYKKVKIPFAYSESEYRKKTQRVRRVQKNVVLLLANYHINET